MDEFRDLYDVINFMIDSDGHHSRKVLAMLLKPECKTEYPDSWLSKVTTRGGNVGVTIAEFDRLIELTGGAEYLMRYLSEKYGIPIPAKELRLTPQDDGSYRAAICFLKQGKDHDAG